MVGGILHCLRDTRRTLCGCCATVPSRELHLALFSLIIRYVQSLIPLSLSFVGLLRMRRTSLHGVVCEVCRRGGLWSVDHFDDMLRYTLVCLFCRPLSSLCDLRVSLCVSSLTLIRNCAWRFKRMVAVAISDYCVMLETLRPPTVSANATGRDFLESSMQFAGDTSALFELLRCNELAGVRELESAMRDNVRNIVML